MPNATSTADEFGFRCGWDANDSGEFNLMGTGQVEVAIETASINGRRTHSVLLSHADIRALHDWLGAVVEKLSSQ